VQSITPREEEEKIIFFFPDRTWERKTISLPQPKTRTQERKTISLHPKTWIKEREKSDFSPQNKRNT
jgi:hypothetical protein